MAAVRYSTSKIDWVPFVYSIPQIRHFQLVAQEGSFARAADISNITQSALSNSIRTLEDNIGFTLFERSTRPVTLTPLGKNFLEQVDRMLFEVRNVEHMAKMLRSGDSGTVQAGMSAITAASLGGPTLAAWHARFPKVHIDLAVRPTKELLNLLRNEDLDFLIGDSRDLQADAGDLDLIAMPSQRGGAFCRAGHPILSIPQPQPADLLKQRFVGTHFPADVRMAFYRYLGIRNPVDPLIVIDCQNIATLRDATVISDLILLTSWGCVRRELELGLLAEIPLALNVRGYWSIAKLANRVLHPAVQKMIDIALIVGKQESENRALQKAAMELPSS